MTELKNTNTVVNDYTASKFTNIALSSRFLMSLSPDLINDPRTGHRNLDWKEVSCHGLVSTTARSLFYHQSVLTNISAEFINQITCISYLPHTGFVRFILFGFIFYVVLAHVLSAFPVFLSFHCYMS